MKTQQTDNNPPIVGPAAKWREVMQKVDQIKVGDTLEVVADHRTAAPAQAQPFPNEPKLGPAERNEVNSLMESAQYDLESVLFNLVYQRGKARHNAQRLADALQIAQRAFTHSPDGVIRFSDHERAQIREALAEWSKSL